MLNAWSEKQLSECFRTAIALAEVVPKLRSSDTVQSMLHPQHNSISSLSRLVLSYLRLMISALSQKQEEGDDSRGTDDHKDETSILPKLLDMIRVSDDLRIASEMLELVSLILPYRDERALQIVIEASFQLIHTASHPHSGSECGDRRIPFSTRRMTRSMKTTATSFEVVRRILKHTVWKCSDAPISKLGQALELQRTLLLRHFGLIYHSQERSYFFQNHTAQLVSDLVSLVGSISFGKDGKKKKSTPRSPMKWNNYSVYFETLLDVSVAGFTVFRPEPTTGRDAPSPYAWLTDAAIIFKTLIMMYADHLEVFPRKTGAVVFQASRLVLEALSLQVRQCVAWRNTQPLPSDARSSNDSGSLGFLQELIEVLASCVCGSLHYLGTRWMNLNDVSNTALKGMSICSSVKKSSHHLSEVATTHKLRRPCFDVNHERTACFAKPKTNDSQSLPDPRTKKRRVILTNEQEHETGSIDVGSTAPEEEENMEDNEFTATGNWCRKGSVDGSPTVASVRIYRST